MNGYLRHRAKGLARAGVAGDMEPSRPGLQTRDAPVLKLGEEE